MLGSLFTPLNRRTPAPPWLLPSFLATGVVSCLPPPKYTLLRVAIGVPAFAGLLLTAPKFTTGEVALDFVTGIFMSAAVLKWLDFAIFHDTDRCFWRTADLRKVWQPDKDATKRSQIGTRSIELGESNELSYEVELVAEKDTMNGHPRNSLDETPQANKSAAMSPLNGHAKGTCTKVQTATGHIQIAIKEIPAEPTAPEDASELKAPISPKADGSWLERLRWSFSLWCTTRGVGWNWKVKNVPDSVPPGYPKSLFLRHTIHRLLFSYLALDFTHACTNWYTASKGDVLPNLWTEPLPTRVAVGWLAALETYNALQWPYYLFATITTATGICKPEQWPNLMGSFSENMWSVRQFWGKCWHSELRRAITQPAKAAVEFFDIPPRTFWSKYTELFISFALSGLTHHAGAYMVGRDTGGMYYLWVGQAAIIMLEDFIIGLGKRAGIQDSAYLRVLGKIWVCAWFCLPTNFQTGAAVVVNRGMGFDPPPLNFSTSALFPLDLGVDNLFKVMADRGIILWLLSKVLSVLEAQSWSEVIEAGMAATAAVAVRTSRSTITVR